MLAVGNGPAVTFRLGIESDLGVLAMNESIRPFSFANPW
jgi:hypothetical protein